MKTVVITGGSSGLGLELAKCFKKRDCNIVITGTNAGKLERAAETVNEVEGTGTVLSVQGNVSYPGDMNKLVEESVKAFESIDIWINNAGVNQPSKALWELDDSEIGKMIDVDLMGTINGSRAAMNQMIKQGGGAIYNVEGYGSNDAMMLGLNMYGTSKRAVTHFTVALAKESEERKTGVIVGRLSPGIMLTDFTKTALGNEKEIELSDKTKNVYNILGDYPDVVAEFLCKKILSNTKNNAHIEWLTNAKAMWKFMTAGKNKKDFFKD